jgi:hypothetical protein
MKRARRHPTGNFLMPGQYLATALPKGTAQVGGNQQGVAAYAQVEQQAGQVLDITA